MIEAVVSHHLRRATLAALSAAERDAWKKLWADVADLATKAEQSR
jgi:hypothetical protein